MRVDALPPQQTEVNVLLVHEDDVAMSGAIRRLHQFVVAGALRPFIAASVANGGGTTAVAIHGAGSPLSADLLDALSGVRVLERIRLVTASSDPSKGSWADDLLEGYRQIRPKIDQTKGRRTSVSDLRVQALAIDERLTGQGIFVATSAANVVLIPHDRSSDHAAARLVRRDDASRFESHLATELATFAGGWCTMTEAPCDHIANQPRSAGDVVVRFSRSLVRALFCPPLPLDRIVPEDGALPTPQGFFPSPNPAATVHAVTEETFPRELRFQPAAPPDQSTEIGLAAALRAVPHRLWVVIKSLPHVLRDGLTRDLESLAGDGLQEIIGRDAWLSIAFRDRQDASENIPWAQRAQASIARLELSDEMPIMSDLPAGMWTSMIERVLGVADGSQASSDARERTGEGRFLLVEPGALSSRPEATPHSTVESFLDLMDQREEPLPDPEPLPPPTAPDEEDQPRETLDAEPAAEQLFESEPPAPRRSLRDSLSHSSAFSLPPGGLLGAITGQFITEKHRADERLESMVDEMRVILQESEQDRDGMQVPLRIRLLLAGGVMLFAFAITVFTGAHRFFDLHWIDLGWRQLIWTVFTAMVLIPCWFVLGSSAVRGRAALAGALGLFVLALFLAFNPAIRDSAPIVRNIGRSYWPMWPLTITAIATAVWTRLVTPKEPGAWRSALTRFIVWWTVFYGMAVLIVSASSAKSILQSLNPKLADTPIAELRHIDPSTRQRLLIILVVISILAFAVGLVAIGVLWVRIEYRNRNRSLRFNFADGEALRSSRERRRLQLLTVQWLGSSAALSRLIWRPLGEIARSENLGREAMVHDNDLLKFDAAGLELTERGEALLLARLRWLLVHPGWLRAQYRRAADTYIEREPETFDQAQRLEDRPTPETDPAVVPLEEILAGRSSGRRWGFASALYDGSLDDALAQVITDNAPDKIFEAVLRDPSAHHTIGAIDEDADLVTYFESLLPAGTQELPVGFSKAVFIANDPRRSMKSYVSWPHDFMPRTMEHGEAIGTVASGLIGGTVIMATRLDVSETFQLEEIADIVWEVAVDPTGLSSLL